MDILVIHSLYIPYIFPRYVPLSSMYKKMINSVSKTDDFIENDKKQ